MGSSVNLRSLLLLAAGIGLLGCEPTRTLEPSAADTAEAEDLAAVFSAAAVDGPVLVPATDQERQRGGGGGSDGRGTKKGVFDTLAEKIPGFGGLYRIEPCAVAIVLVDSTDIDRAIAIVEEVVDPLVRRGCPDGIEVKAVEGTFTYVQLLRIRHAIRPLHQIRGVVGAKIDFQQNKVIVAVSSREVLDEVRAAIARLGVPPAAIGVQVGRR